MPNNAASCRSSPNRAVDRKSTRLNSSHTEIYTLSLHDALPIYGRERGDLLARMIVEVPTRLDAEQRRKLQEFAESCGRSEEHTSELQSHRDLHSFPTRRSSDLRARARRPARAHDRGSADAS